MLDSGWDMWSTRIGGVAEYGTFDGSWGRCHFALILVVHECVQNDCKDTSAI